MLSPTNLALLTQLRVWSYLHIPNSRQASSLSYLFMWKGPFAQIICFSVSFPVSFWWPTSNLLQPSHKSNFPHSTFPFSSALSHNCSLGIHLSAPKLKTRFTFPIIYFPFLFSDTLPSLQLSQPFSSPLVSTRLSITISFLAHDLLCCFFPSLPHLTPLILS